MGESMIDLYPTSCNLCQGEVVYTSNSVIYYGKEFGSGKCYLCKNCGAYTGTHKPRPHEELGLLTNERMRKGKIMCHEIFDTMWKGKPNERKLRIALYKWLAKQLEIPSSECHFGWFDLEMLIAAYRILKKNENLAIELDKNWNFLVITF